MDLTESKLEGCLTLTEKQHIAATARTLIRLLQECDDEEFVDKVVDCVTNFELIPLFPEYI